jgi:hypothetical protein
MYPLSHGIKNGYEFLMYLILNEKNVHILEFKKKNQRPTPIPNCKN